MPTPDDINFNELYSIASYFFLLLYDHGPHPSPPVELPNADVLTYVRPFGNLLACQQHVDDYRQKVITLFTTDRTFLRWHEDPPGLSPNLMEIFVYCDTLEGRSRILRSQNSYGKNIQKVIMAKKLDFHLLTAGLEYIDTVSEEFKDDPDAYDQFHADGQRIVKAMAGYFEHGATKFSEEASA